MRARAPGKLVLSGAYSVLEGAPAIVAAVDRYVVADTARPAEIVTAEVAEAVRRGCIPRAIGFDASALRQPLPGGGSRKLGLGSSAAILVASLAAFDLTGPDVLDALFHVALDVHRTAQGGGSGLDVAASCYGGVHAFRLGRGVEVMTVAQHPLPDVLVEAWACPGSADTAAMLERVRRLKAESPADHARCLDAAKEGAEAAVAAKDAAAFIAAIGAQRAALAELGRRADAPIMTAEVDELDRAAQAENGRFYPSGAGGGDVALFVARAPSSPDFRARAAALGLFHVPLAVGAPGASRD